MMRSPAALGAMLVLLAAREGRAQTDHCLACLDPPCTDQQCEEYQPTLYIGGLFATYDGDRPGDPGFGKADDLDGGLEEHAVFRATIDLINNKDSEHNNWFNWLLPNVTIVAEVQDSACSARAVECANGAAKEMTRAGNIECIGTLAEPNPERSPVSPGAAAGTSALARWPMTTGHHLDAIVGPGCSGASDAAAYIAEELKVPMVSYSATSKTLSGRSPYYFRVSTPDAAKAKAVAGPEYSGGVAMGQTGLLAHFGWTKIAVISTAKSYGTTMAADIRSTWQAGEDGVCEHPAGHDVMFERQIETREAGWELDGGQLHDALKDLQASGVRVVVVCGHTNDVGDILQAVGRFDIGTTVTGTTWIATTDSVPNPSDGGGFNTMRDGLFAITTPEPTGLITNAFRQQYGRLMAADASYPGVPSFRAVDSDDGAMTGGTLGREHTLHTYSWNVHDSVMVVAMAFHNMLYGGDLPAGCNADPAVPLESGGCRQTLRDHIEASEFAGVSGDVSFDDNHDRANPSYDIKNLAGGSWVKVGVVVNNQAFYQPPGVVGSPSWSDETVWPDIPTDYVEPPLALEYQILIGFLIAFIVFGALFVHFYRLRKKRINKWKREHALEIAEKDKQKAIDAIKKAQEDKKNKQEYPDLWARVPGTVTAEQPKGMPVDGLIEVKHDSKEYWDVVDQLRADPEPSHALPRLGKSGTVGMRDAWVTKLERIQNLDLFTYNQFQRTRVEGDVVDGWHGTGSFPASNIYNDRQDGFMMQFASKGQWGSGLYFAREAGYSDIYASKGRKMPPGTTDMAPDESEMMLASLLLGDVIELDRDNDTTMGGHIPGIRKYCNDLKVPPHKSATPSRKKPEDGVDVATAAPGITSGARYNTVRGYTQTDKPPAHAGGKWTKNETCPRSQVWIVYENGRAYPKYLVRYYRGAYDPSRVTCERRPSGGGTGNSYDDVAPPPPYEAEPPPPGYTAP